MEERKLNLQQKEAVEHGEGPLLIIAGAGTGKTTVITERVKHLIMNKHAQPAEILALTFTEKAAQEMEGRIDEALPYGYTQMWIMTFHGFCDRVLKQDGFHIGLDTNFRLMTTAESLDLLRRNLYALGLNYFAPLGNPTKFLFGLLNHFSRLQDENISSSEYLKWAEENFSLHEVDSKKKVNEEILLEAQKWQELAHAYQKYEELKIKNSLMDFGDLIVNTIKLYKMRPNVLAEYQKKFKFMLVDEFQDTNFAQTILSYQLAGKAGNITVVGDDDQAVYRFRGASVSNMIQFKEQFPQAKIVTLIQNYRSKQKILDAAHVLVSHNNPDRLEVLENIDKRLVSTRSGLSVIECINANNATDEAAFVVNKILEIKEEKKFRFSDFAILVRANNHADSFIRALDVANVPYQFLGPGKLFFEPEIADLLSYLRVLSDIHNDASLYQVLSMDIFAIDPLSLAKLSSFARREHRFLFDVLQALPPEAEQDTSEKVAMVMTLIRDHVTRSKSESSGVLLLDFLEKSGIRSMLLKGETSEALQKAQNIEKFFGKLKSFETMNPLAKVFDVVNWIDLQLELGQSPLSAEIDWQSEDKVNILTVHSSKGLEFPVVFLVNLVGQRFPSMERREPIPIPQELVHEVLPTGDFHMQEERRLFYVGMTRARDYLYMTAAQFYGEAKRMKKVSPFVSEALGDIAFLTAAESTLTLPEIEKPVEIEAIPKKMVIKNISYSDIETFKICPLHYKLSSILKVPTPPSAAQSFGISFHSTMKLFYEDIKQGKNPSKEVLHSALEKEWKREGFISSEHAEKSYEKAKGFIDYYFDNWFDTKVQPIALEQPFSFKLNSVYVKGKIDRIDQTPSGIHIIDYKTGSTALNQKEVDENLQLSIYALAATKIQEPPFNQKPTDVTLSLMYFDDPQIVTTHRTMAQLKAAETEILEWVQKIEESDFSCSGNYLCNNCEYKLFCKSTAE